jgi:hypothetical protein
MANGQPLTKNSLRQAILRCFEKERLACLIEQRREKEKHGREMLWIRRRI